ncbi:hypothetical protein OH76DRAFT_1423309 [Lentinus brumalis]|uniref:Uncharacterized protein n=1 Tax=Lentinus brumalis TaxID=2498619 RepID=A0A371CLF1_9APHY|nr:hypothetical protein OH76DRAFT_1423309 [Polyporus brumalis]
MNSPSLPESVSHSLSSTADDSKDVEGESEETDAVARMPRNEVRAEIRANMRQELFDITGILDPIGMRWTNKLFLKNIVGIYDCGLFGWPPDIPFQCLSRIKTEPLRKLLRLWNAGELRIAKLTDEQRAQAAVDPTAFLPNTTLRPPSPPPPAEHVLRVVPLVLHPVDFHDLSQRPADDPSGSAPAVLTTTVPSKKRKRKQRCDIKRARTRARRYGLGVKSPEYVYDAADPESGFERVAMPFCEALSDDYVEEFPGVVTEVEDDIEQFTEPEPEEDEIESASESWMLGERSEVDEMEDNEE